MINISTTGITNIITCMIIGIIIHVATAIIDIIDFVSFDAFAI